MRRIDLRRDDGVAMTEFALILPVFVLIIVGLLAFGRVFFYWIEANHLANETARWAIVDRNPYAPGPDAAAARRAELDDRVRERTSRCASTSRTAPRDLGDPLRVRVQKPFTLRADPRTSGTITIRGSSTMRDRELPGTGGDPAQLQDGPVTGGDVGTCT